MRRFIIIVLMLLATTWYWGVLLPAVTLVLVAASLYTAILSIGFFRADKVEARRNAVAGGGIWAALDGTTQLDNDPGENRQLQYGAAADMSAGGKLVRNAKLSLASMVRAYK